MDMTGKLLRHRGGALVVICGLLLFSLPLHGCAKRRGEGRPVRVLVLNMHAGKDAAGASNLDRIAALVAERQPDLVLLQEVDRGTARSGGVDQLQTLRGATGYDGAFIPSLEHYDGGKYGLALLARDGMSYTRSQPLTVIPAQTRAGGSVEPRTALASLVAAGGRQWIAINTHLDPRDAKVRAQEAAVLVAFVREQSAIGRPVLVGGDFNSTPDAEVQQTLRAAGLRDAWTTCGTGDGYTFPAAAPDRRIDYLFLTGALQCTSAEVLDSQASDHRPLLVTVTTAGT